MLRFIDQCDGIVLSTAEPYEAEAIAQITAWFQETSREVYTFGHLLPVSSNAESGEQKQSEKSEEIVNFLQKTHETDGPNSLLYVSSLHVPYMSLIIDPSFRFRSARFSGLHSPRKFGHSSIR